MREMLAYWVPGRMPLPLAWMVAVLLIPPALVLLANSLAGTAVDEFVFFGLIIGSAMATIVIARLKRRRLWVWGLVLAFSLWSSLLLVGPLFQPMTVALAVVLTQRAGPRAATPLDVSEEPDSGAMEPGGPDGLTEGAAPGLAIPVEVRDGRKTTVPRESRRRRTQPPGQRPFRRHRPRRR